MQDNVYTREGNHIGPIWSRVTCLSLMLAIAQSFEHQALGVFQSRRRLTIATGNKALQTKKMVQQIVPND
jgi:hypothetical protein